MRNHVPGLLTLVVPCIWCGRRFGSCGARALQPHKHKVLWWHSRLAQMSNSGPKLWQLGPRKPKVKIIEALGPSRVSIHQPTGFHICTCCKVMSFSSNKSPHMVAQRSKHILGPWTWPNKSNRQVAHVGKNNEWSYALCIARASHATMCTYNLPSILRSFRNRQHHKPVSLYASPLTTYRWIIIIITLKRYKH